MRPTHLALAGATLAIVLTTACSHESVVHAQADPASRALAYLASQQGADGSVGGFVGASEDTVIGAADAGFDPATLVAPTGNSVFDFLAAATVAGKTDGSASATAKLILALVAGHRDPSAFGGKDPLTELMSPAQYDATPADSTYGDFDPAFANTFSQALGILALHAAGQAVPGPAVTALLGMRRSGDHGWGYDTSSFTTMSDTNSTALALEALAAVGQASGSPLSGALGYLHTAQRSDGGFPFDLSVATPQSDPNSDAFVLQALVSVGQDPAAAAWTVGGHTAGGNLSTFEDAATGGFVALGKTAPDAFTTSEIPAALEGLPYGAPTTFTVGSSLASQRAVAVAALRYLASQQGADGSVGGFVGASEDTVIGAADAGFDPATLVAPTGNSVFDFLAAATVAGKTDGSASATAKLILALVAGHRDPSVFGGKDPLTELMSPAQYDATPADSTYGDFDPAFANTFSQALGILALHAAGQAVPGPAVTALLGMRRSGDHGWGYDTSSFTTMSDTNSTALALEALAAVGQASGSPLSGALGYLHTAQRSDGGFPFDLSVATPQSDPNSDAFVLQALVSVGQDPFGSAWVAKAGTLPGDLLGFRDAASGGFVALGKTAPDAFTTSEIPAALERLPYGAATRFAAGASLALPAPAPVTTPAPTALPSATPTSAVQGVSGAPATGGGGALAADGAGGPAGAWVAAAVLLGAAAGVPAIGGRRRRRRRGC